MPESKSTAFISYSRVDSEFALRLARDLKAAGASVWIDQLDITAGAHWDNAIENALLDAPQMLVVLTPASSQSSNVRNEIAFALDQGKIVVPVIYKDCIVPLQLQRQNRIDFRADYARGLAALLDHLRVAHPDRTVLDKATEEESSRKAAWHAREMETRRLEEFAERERQEHALRQKEAAERIALEMAERKERKEPDGHAREQTGQQARHAVSGNALDSENIIVSAGGKPLASRFAGILKNPWLVGAIVAAACLVTSAYIFMFHWSSRAGAHWTARVSDLNQPLGQITGSSDGRVLYACGVQPLKSADGGATWVLQTGGARSCRTVFVTANGTRFFLYAGVEQDRLFTVYVSSDGGTSWRKVDSNPLSGPTPEVGRIDSIFGTADGGRIWALQTRGDMQHEGLQGVISESQDSGSTWMSRSGVVAYGLLSLAGLSDGSYLVAVGNHGLIISSKDGGANWQSRNGGTQEQLNGVFVGANAKLVCAVGFNGAIVVSTDEGTTWTKRPVGTTVDLSGVFGTSDGKYLWAVGDSGTVLESNDSGSTWFQRSTGNLRYTDLEGKSVAPPLYSVFGTPDGKHLWAVGAGGTILESKSGFY